MLKCKILADSVNLLGARLTTMEITFARMMLPEFNTHRMFSRNTASSRAIPVKKLIEQVRTNCMVPQYFGKNQPGMQATTELAGEELATAQGLWRQGAANAVLLAEDMVSLGIHKEIVNRVLEPYLWTTVIVSATEYGNFFRLRCHPAAQRDIQAVAYLMREARENSTPVLLQPGEWHVPLLDDKIELLQKGFTHQECLKIAVGRCCRVSYLTHNGVRDPIADLDLSQRLLDETHLSPWEHIAKATNDLKFYANFRGFQQYRGFIESHQDYGITE